MDEYAKEMAGLVRIIRRGIQREVSEMTSVAPSAKPLV
ncbi:hypothetical protein J2739_002558 [Variovorax soli]|uniref:Uncharacterized protein n=1 Tax=Variovorax soli TaxID=376815 RepID=A0ABU1NEA8_9BURK|nr:hypothetical protein [Variovorax soli]